jgi:hypothetical protein
MVPRNQTARTCSQFPYSSSVSDLYIPVHLFCCSQIGRPVRYLCNVREDLLLPIPLHIYYYSLGCPYGLCVFKFCHWLSLDSAPMLELGDGSLRATLATSEEDTIQFPFCVENHANTIRKSVHNRYTRACQILQIRNCKT